ncbi:PTS fructose transporter subunit IIB [Collinsella tanakaei]|nr:PTS fructose transporter subunit IIB [Collinsella tanakaei]
MNIVGVTACTAGIAHTYLVKEKLVNAARELGHTAKIETQGSIGTENTLTAEDIRNADVVIISADIEISNRDRFAGKRIVDVPMKAVMRAPKKLLEQIEQQLNASAK